MSLDTEAIAEPWPDRLSAALLRLDEDPRAIAVGVLLGAGLAGLQAIDSHETLHIVASLLLVVAFCAPTAGLAAVAILIPLVPIPMFGSLNYASVALAATIGGCAVRMYLDRTSIRVRLAPALLLVYLALSAYSVLRPITGFTAERRAAGASQLLELTIGVGLVFAAMYLRQRTSTRMLVGAVVLGACAAAGLGLFTLEPQLLTRFGSDRFVGTTVFQGRAFGSFTSSNYFGLFEAIAFVIVCGWRLEGGRGLQLLRAAAVILIGGALLASLSRGAILAVLAGVLVLAFQRSRRLGLAATAVAALALFVGFPLFVAWRLHLTSPGATDAAQAALEASTGWRFDTLYAGWRLFLNWPVFGIGFGQFHFESGRYLASGVPINYSHNWYVNVLAEQGIVGFGVYLGLLVAIGWTLVRSAEPLARVALAAFVVFLVGSLTTEPVSSAQATGDFWIIVGLGLAAAFGGADLGGGSRFRATIAPAPSTDVRTRSYLSAEPARGDSGGEDSGRRPRSGGQESLQPEGADS